MIVDYIINFSFTVLNFIIQYLPTADSNVIDLINNSIPAIRSAIVVVNLAIDVNTLGNIITNIILIEVGLFTIHGVQWILANISGGIFKRTKG